MSASPSNDKQSDDWITLYGGKQTSYWKIPKHLKRCPVSNCGKKFEDLKSLSEHFSRSHAKRSAYCGICNGPVICKNHPEDLASHYRRIHPGVPFQCDQTKIKVEPQLIEV